MAILVFAESPKGQFKKSAFEAVSYGKKVGDIMQQPVHALVLGEASEPGQLGAYGADKVIHISDPSLNDLDSQVFANVISQAVEAIDATVVVLNHNSTGKSLLGRIAARLNAGSVSAVNSLPDLSNGFTIQKNVFSGKAIARYAIDSDIKVLSLMGNTFPPEKTGSEASVESLDLVIPPAKVAVKEVSTVSGTTPLPEAELVVSAGRGMKGPENWGIIEELANTLGATTACSRPVADSDWRPHHEHVGQTGIAIRPNLYIAIGISGAIQHLAGVNRSKVIVVINKDPEAPFFKVADYGICADLFDVVPRLTEALKAYKAQHA